MAHINISLNHIKGIGYTKYFSEEEAKLTSFTVLNNEEVVELTLVNKENKRLDRIVTFEHIEDIMNSTILSLSSKIKEMKIVSPTAEQKTNTLNETTKTDKMEEHNSNILKTTEKINKIMFDAIKELDGVEPTSLYINKTKAICQASQVIINAAKVEMEYLKRFGNGKS